MSEFVLEESEPKYFKNSFSGITDGHDEWLTPPAIVSALGQFDLDPCSPIVRPWPTATQYFTIEDNGLIQPWSGRVWLNPPYGNKTHIWLKKMASHKSGIALIFARTETKMFIESIWSCAHTIFFFFGRICFHRVQGRKTKLSAGAPSMLVSWSEFDSDAIRNSGLKGKQIWL